VPTNEVHAPSPSPAGTGPSRAGTAGRAGVSVIIPAYNEAAGVGHVVRSVVQVLQGLGRPFELIVVDDCSTDGTGDLAREAGAQVVSHSRNKGYGGSLKTGVRAARYPIVLFYDADGQFNANDIGVMLDYIPTYDMATGWRDSRSHVPGDRLLGKRMLGWVANYLARQKIPDLNCGFRAIKREVLLRYLHLLPDGFSASTTTTLLLLKEGFNVRFVPTVIEPRVGTSTVKPLQDGVRTMLLILRLITLLDPFRVFFPVSAVLAVLGIAWGVPFMAMGFGLSVGALFLLVSALIIFFFGLVVDQVAAIRREQAAFYWEDTRR
jgi:glycosyltransferase involved in cell wall biosynthesis